MAIILRTVLLLLVTLSIFSCSGKTKYRLAVSEEDPNYQQTALYLQKVLQRDGYEIEIIKTENSLVAAEMITQGKADLGFIMNTTPLFKTIGDNIVNVRTIAPLFNRVLYVMHKEENPSVFFKDLSTLGKTYVGAEGSERGSTILEYYDAANITDYELTYDEDSADVQIFWGDVSAFRAKEMIPQGWKIFSFVPNALRAFKLRMGKVEPYELPPFWQTGSLENIHTLSSDVLLITNRKIYSQQIYNLTFALFKQRQRLSDMDPIYGYMTENFNRDAINFPLHLGAEQYFGRANPSFLERYAEVIALIITITIITNGIIGTVRRVIRNRRRENIDPYFERILELETTRGEQKILQLNNLLQDATHKMISDNIDKQDYHMLSQRIFEEIKKEYRNY